jgi:hypothetical protein
VTSLIAFFPKSFRFLASLFLGSVLLLGCANHSVDKQTPTYATQLGAQQYGLIESPATTLPLNGNAWAIRSSPSQNELVVALDKRVYVSRDLGQTWRLLTTSPLANDVFNIGLTEKGNLIEFTSAGKAFVWKNGSWEVTDQFIWQFHDAVRLNFAENDVPHPCLNDIKYAFSLYGRSFGNLL